MGLELVRSDVQTKVATFDEFWQIYPRKIARRYAQKCWERLTAAEKLEAVRVMPQHIAVWRDEDRAADKIPHCSTWLNQGRWEDELTVAMPEKIYCGWPGCKLVGLHRRGSGAYCESHFNTLQRGGTPPR